MVARVLAVSALLVGLTSLPAAAHQSDCAQVVDHPAACTHVQVFGHRGRQWKTDTNENTLLAFRQDAKVGASFEADAWVLADGTPVVFHDKRLGRVVDRTSMPAGVTGRTLITKLTLPVFRQLLTKGGQPLITVRRLIRFSGRNAVPGMIEDKYGLLDSSQMTAWVQQFRAPVSFYLTPKCRDSGVVRPEFADLGIRVGAKYLGDCRPTIEQLAEAGFSYVLNAAAAITAPYVKEAHRARLEVGNFDSGDTAVWAQLVNAGVDYIVAPHPGRLKRWLG